MMENRESRDLKSLPLDLLKEKMTELSEKPFRAKQLYDWMLQQTARLTTAARAAGMPVVFTNDAHIPGIDRELALWGTHGIAGTPEAQTSPLLDPQPTDYVVEKRRYSGFFQTGLLLLLNELGVDTLICCGMDTNICVKHTVADAYFNNFNIIVVGDATATFLVGNQEEGLEYMKVCYAAKIVDTDEAVKLIEG